VQQSPAVLDPKTFNINVTDFFEVNWQS